MAKKKYKAIIQAPKLSVQSSSMRLIFLVLNIKRQTTDKKKNALHLELEWVKLAHFCHEFCQIC